MLRTTDQLQPGDEIVRGHAFPWTLYTGVVERVERLDDNPGHLNRRVVCRDGMWKCGAADTFTVKDGGT